MELALTSLSVEVSAHADVRGCLMVDPSVPAGFQRIDAQVRITAKNDTDAARIKTLVATAERCCVVLQTLRSDVPVLTSVNEPAERVVALSA